jgi:predicted ferric reductase
MAIYCYNSSDLAFSRDVCKSYSSASNKMTLKGVILKSLISILLVASIAWLKRNFNSQNYSIDIHKYGGLTATLLFSFLTACIHRMAQTLAPLYTFSVVSFINKKSEK